MNSQIEQSIPFDALLDELQVQIDAIPARKPEVCEERSESFTKRRLRKGENPKPTPLQHRYQRQIRDSQARDKGLVDSMARMVAWTYLPGRDRKDCPPIVELRAARLLVMDRFPEVVGDLSDHIGLSMFRIHANRRGHICYAAPDNLEMFKDFSIRPHFHAGGLCLDSRNEEVFKAALALDQSMRLVAKGKMEPVATFSPPPVLAGFPDHFTPKPEYWRQPMRDAVLRAFQPDTPVLRCFAGPGGIVKEVEKTQNGFRVITIEKDGAQIQVIAPNWTILSPITRIGNVVEEGQPLADLPRANYTRFNEITCRFLPRALEWLESRILEELTESVTAEENVLDKETKQSHPCVRTWRCLPLPFVQSQASRAVRHFLNMRDYLGRTVWNMDGFEKDVWTVDAHKVCVAVMQVDRHPTVEDFQFCDGPDVTKSTWTADLLSLPDGPWGDRYPLRSGLVQAV